MGGHYGSVQVLTADRTAVIESAERVCRAKNIRCLVGPSRKGWVGVYPESNGQDESVGRAISDEFGGTVLHVLVHDDDVFAYWLWRDRLLVDKYWSKPGYFGQENVKEEERRTGDPEQFGYHLDQGDVAKLRDLLRRGESPVLESERLKRFGELLKIDNLVTAFEYLTGDDSSGVIGWPRRFREVPAARAQAERARRAAEKTRIKGERVRLAAMGLLLVSEVRLGLNLNACAAGDGFVVVWQGHWGRHLTVERYAPPWTTPTAVPEFVSPTTQFVSGLAGTKDGRRLAIAGGGSVRVMDWTDSAWHLVKELTVPRFAGDVTISPDGQFLSYKLNDPRQLLIRRIDGVEVMSAPRLAMDQQVAFTYDCKSLVVAAIALGVVRVADQPTWRSYPVRGPVRSSRSLSLATIDVDAIVAAKRAEMSSESPKPTTPLSPDASQGPLQSQAASEMLESVLASLRERLTAVRDGLLSPVIARGENCFCVGFDSTERWLWVGTEAGIRVYSWPAVAAAMDGVLPMPIWSYDPPLAMPHKNPSSNLAFIYTGVAEPDGTGVVFGGLNSELFRIDLLTGRVQSLMRMPGGGVIFKIAISTDSSALITCSTVRDRHGMTVSSACEIWNYQRLLSNP